MREQKRCDEKTSKQIDEVFRITKVVIVGVPLFVSEQVNVTSLFVSEQVNVTSLPVEL